LSVGGTDSDPADETAIADAIAANVTVVAAAGNDGAGSTLEYPAGYPGVISVGASAVTDSAANTYTAITGETVATYSNSGPTLVAPGGDVTPYGGDTDTDILHWVEAYSTTTSGDPSFQCTVTAGVCRALWNGTSQATPQVAGTVALMLAVAGGSRSLSPAAVKTILTSTADVIPGIATGRQGAGRLDVSAAVSAAH